MKTSDFYYDLPQELIAQDPLEDRSSSRLMHLSLKDGSIEHRHFTDILDYLHKGDCLVINDTKVGVGVFRIVGKERQIHRPCMTNRYNQRLFGFQFTT